uniref:Uncharacterized protein n=1 Tax=Oryza meridionalis TaxID=40149 RepID=A0A0E0F332_9ORYZ
MKTTGLIRKNDIPFSLHSTPHFPLPSPLLRCDANTLRRSEGNRLRRRRRRPPSPASAEAFQEEEMGPREQRVKGSKLLSGRFLRIGGILKERCSDGISQAMWRHKEGGGAGADGRGRWRWHWLGKKRGNRSEKRTRDVMGWHRGSDETTENQLHLHHPHHLLDQGIEVILRK